MDWIKAPVRYRDDPRIHDMASKLNITFEAALGRYMSALMFCGDHETVALPASLDGPTREALRGAGLHDGKRFVDHDSVVGSLARARAQERERKKKESRKLLNQQKEAPRNSGAYREGEGDRERERDKAETEKSKASAAPAGRAASWSRDACDDWIARFKGTAPGGQIGKALKRLVDAHGWETVRPAWQRYLAETEADYASPARFASTFGTWAGTVATVTRRSPARGPAPAARFRAGTYAPSEED